MNWTPVLNWLAQHGAPVLLIIAASVALYFVLRHFVPVMVERTISRTMKGQPRATRNKRADTINAVFVDTGIVVIVIVAVFTILAQLGIPVAPALAGLGVAGIAIGFGAQSLVRDLFNGILILMENQFGVGDWVSISGVDGLVEDINLRRTTLRDFNGTMHSIPNGEIKVASNFTKEWARVNIDISVAYGEDLDRVIDVINSVGEEIADDPDWEPHILEAPYALRVQEFGDSGIAIKIIGRTEQMQQWAVMGELRLRLKRAFDEQGIEIPWPHMKLFFGNAPVEAGAKEVAERKPPSAAPRKRQVRKEQAPEDEGGD